MFYVFVIGSLVVNFLEELYTKEIAPSILVQKLLSVSKCKITL